MTLGQIVAKRDEKLQAYDNKIYSLANCADLYPHLHDDLETMKKLFQESYAPQELLIMSIETLQHLLRKYMGY